MPEPIVPIPEKFRVERSPASLRIGWRWFTPAVFLLLPFAIAWDGFLIFWYANALTVGDGRFSLFAMIFPLAHVAVGVCLTYYCLALLFNATRIEVTSHGISISRGPLPWTGNRWLSSGGLRQLFIQRKEHRRRAATTETFELHAVTTENRQIRLVTGLESMTQARYLESQIEGFLGIPQQPVEGEQGKA